MRIEHAYVLSPGKHGFIDNPSAYPFRFPSEQEDHLNDMHVSSRVA